MPVQVESTEATRYLEDHELTALQQLADNLKSEEGFLVAGKFESKAKKLHGTEIDGILILVDLVLVIEMKQRYAKRIELYHLDDNMYVYRPDSTAPKSQRNPLTRLAYTCRDIRSRLIQNYGVDPKFPVFSAFVAYPSGPPFTLCAGEKRIERGVAQSLEAAVGQIDDIQFMVDETRQFLRLRQPNYPLTRAQQRELHHLKNGVLDSVTRLRVDTNVIGDFHMTTTPVMEEPEIKMDLFEGEELLTESPVWIKRYQRDMLLPRKQQQQETLLTLRESFALDQLHGHRSIPIYRTKIDDGGKYVYVVLRREPGQFLHEYMTKSRPVAERLRILSDILEGLDHIHSIRENNRTALYRDLRPQTVFVTARGDAQLFNFDCCRLPTQVTVQGKAQRRAALWRDYAAPELLEGQTDHITTATDIYSWSVLAYEMLTGQVPYTNARKQARGDFNTLDTFDHISISSALSNLIEQGLQPIPDIRPTIAEIRVALQREQGAQHHAVGE
ncbi:MAG: hypothetical protein GFH27_549291n173 [Chloroflexi bacterium AL-W]|nr:hypothetical protein [Chloroflexi bacterium AL-N1]NOK67361.1 hypothetical protein [Chloroflexi bacterium AL-N10]NOK75147.1 hypothetical protein [Chloroflexi bacterium AL-N5]NOK81935.1 hypothetical protein [Chloroflexi bacterium AL-W]NOK89780.1 hypothetical protein [Chloroflexi bacterium AL-N15]